MSDKLFKSLLFKVARIQTEIEREQKSKWPDRIRLLRLKKIRLFIKDRLTSLVRAHLTANDSTRLLTSRMGKPVLVRDHSR